MRVLILGGAGFIGQRIVAALQAQGGWQVRVASRRARPGAAGVEVVKADTLDAQALRQALDGCSAVVNCVTGSGHTIVEGARQLALALNGSSCQRLVHMSSMAAYGDVDGRIGDDTPLGSGGGWYAQAKRDAEALLAPLAKGPNSVVMLRPGCVHGPGSHLWVQRMGRWLQSGRLGDLGAVGDGWSNLVHVDDVAAATVAALRWAAPSGGTGGLLVANLSAPDSPRWNDYLLALGVAIGAVPVRRVPAWQLKADSRVAAVPLRIWERLAPRLGLPQSWAPPALAPSLLVLLQQDRRLLSQVATQQLGVQWTPFATGVAQSAQWFRGQV
jgi:nucleoside-diphosphate-sugar epimerase